MGWVANLYSNTNGDYKDRLDLFFVFHVVYAKRS